MKVLAVTGFPCPAEKWQRFLSSFSNLEVIDFRTQIESAANRRDLRSLGRFVGEQITARRPDLLIAHDFGVPTTVMGLLKTLQKMPDYKPKVLFFNSALRELNLFKSTHPLKIQGMSWHRIRELVMSSGGECDPELEKYRSDITAIYRQIVIKTIVDFTWSKLKKESKRPRLNLGQSVLVIRSDDDPYFPGETVQKMAEDIEHSNVVTINYGHFPYTQPITRFTPHIEN